MNEIDEYIRQYSKNIARELPSLQGMNPDDMYAHAICLGLQPPYDPELEFTHKMIWVQKNISEFWELCRVDQKTKFRDSIQHMRDMKPKNLSIIDEEIVWGEIGKVFIKLFDLQAFSKKNHVQFR